jgi:phosphoribosylglycinamide formyltransferase-1
MVDSGMKKARLGILISGRGSNMEALIRACKDPSYPAEVVLVISNKGTAPGLEKARNEGIEAVYINPNDYTGRSEYEEQVHKLLIQKEVDIVCLAGYMKILGAEFVQKWTDRILNIHPSLLPDYQGLDTYARALADQRSESGCTVHYVISELDSGPAIVQKRVPVLADDTPETLAERILVQEHVAYPEAVRIVAERLLKSSPIKQ